MKKLYLLFIVFFSFLLVWCGNKVTTNENTNVVFNKSDCMKWCEIVRDQKTSKEVMLNDCEKTCEIWESVATNDKNWCEDSDESLKNDCYSSVAYETSNYSLCKKISDVVLQYWCYTSIASKLKDITICNEVAEVTRKKSCEEWVKNNEESVK
jgi:hypothetical protein